MSNEKFEFNFLFEKLKLVIVLQVSSVKLIEGFSGIWSFFFPQYLTKAILLGDAQVYLPLSIVFEYFVGINCCSFILL